LETDTVSTSTEYAVEMDGITRRFGDFVAVDNVTLKIPKGHLYGFLGNTIFPVFEAVQNWIMPRSIRCRIRAALGCGILTP
jgi:hypothetical protein